MLLNATILEICLQRCSHTQPLPQVPSGLIVGDRMLPLTLGGPWSGSSKKKLDIKRGYPYGKANIKATINCMKNYTHKHFYSEV